MAPGPKADGVVAGGSFRQGWCWLLGLARIAYPLVRLDGGFALGRRLIPIKRGGICRHAAGGRDKGRERDGVNVTA